MSKFRLALVRQKYRPDGGAERFVSRALEALGVTHLTGVIVTHMDKDHYGGAKQLAESDIAIDGWYASWAWEKEKWKKHPVVKAAAIRGEEITLPQDVMQGAEP